LIGANGVGRRTLKKMLIEYRPYEFAGIVPITSRAPKQGEQHGREYFFERKEDVLQLIRDRQMIEWGEYNDQLYGTTAESVRQVIRSGRVCVLDCSPKAISSLYNSEYFYLFFK
uniref:Guanylate kinase-like domain-containing protein n=1 Tax=Meloidogyne javanica TaxID=6303 RepID=A0A915MV33_MELJA